MFQNRFLPERARETVPLGQIPPRPAIVYGQNAARAREVAESLLSADLTVTATDDAEAAADQIRSAQNVQMLVYVPNVAGLANVIDQLPSGCSIFVVGPNEFAHRRATLDPRDRVPSAEISPALRAKSAVVLESIRRQIEGMQPSQPKTVLVYGWVHSTLVAALAQTIRDAGYEVVQANDFIQAMKQLLEQPEIRVLVLAVDDSPQANVPSTDDLQPITRRIRAIGGQVHEVDLRAEARVLADIALGSTTEVAGQETRCLRPERRD